MTACVGALHVAQYGIHKLISSSTIPTLSNQVVEIETLDFPKF